MKNSKIELYFLFILLIIVFVLSFFIFKPLIYPLILAVVFATVFDSIHKKILIVTRQNKNYSALITTLLVATIVITPIIFLSAQIFNEANILYSQAVNNGGMINLSDFITNKLHYLEKISPVQIDFTFNIDQYIKSGLNWLINNIGVLFSNALSVIGSSLIFLFTLFYLFKNGDELKKSLIKLSPLGNNYDNVIFTKLELGINSVVIGSLLIAIMQGIFMAIGFTLFHIPNPILWGSVTMLLSLIPTIGTAIILVPTIIFVFLKGNLFYTIAFAIWGFVTVNLIDNVLKPKLIQRGIMIHPFIILLSVLGGIILFGPLGLLLGPLVIDLLFVLLEIYSLLQK